MKPFRVLFCILLLAGTAHAQSSDEPNPKFFQNYTGVVNLLRANGVNAAALQWSIIEQVCAPFNDTKNPTDYNRCRFEKARDQSWFISDRQNCDNGAVADYPDSLLGNQPIDIIRYRNGTSSTTTIQQPSVSFSDLQSMRAGSYDKCMSSKGWRDSHDYLAGRTKDSGS